MVWSNEGLSSQDETFILDYFFLNLSDMGRVCRWF